MVNPNRNLSKFCSVRNCQASSILKINIWSIEVILFSICQIPKTEWLYKQCLMMDLPWAETDLLLAKSILFPTITTAFVRIKSISCSFRNSDSIFWKLDRSTTEKTKRKPSGGFIGLNSAWFKKKVNWKFCYTFMEISFIPKYQTYYTSSR